jgi:hypothetical protein
MIEVEVQVGMYRIMCSHQWKLKLTTFGYARQPRDMEHEPILQMVPDRFVPEYAYHKPFTAKFFDRCDWKNGFKLDIKGGLALYTAGPRLI